MYQNARSNGKDRLRVFENGFLRRIFEPKRKEVIGNWIDNVKWLLLLAKYSIMEEDGMGGTCGTYRGNAYSFLLGKPGEKEATLKT